MFFLLSKILAFLIKPLNWAIALLLVALFSKKVSVKGRMLRLALGLLVFFSNPLLINLALDTWEVEPVSLAALEQTYDVGLVLGGYVSIDAQAPADRLNLNEAGSRLINALELYQQGKIKKILLSGASGKILDPEYKEATEVTALLKNAGIPESDILIDPFSKNTYENIRNSKEVMEQHFPQASVLLITSAFHMRRALLVCEKQQLPVTPFSADIRHKRYSFALNDWLLPDAKAFQHWDVLIKEWAGIVAYWMKGYL